MKHDPQKEEALFNEALEIEAGEERQAFLERACDGDSDLRAKVNELLSHHFQASGFLSKAAIDESPTLALSQDPAEGPGSQIGRYKLLQVIGEGGFGVVYMAEQKVPVKRRVALKIIKLGMDTKQVVARFEAERQALAMMDHLNIAKVLDAGATESGRPYFVMELVKGISITQYCRENRLTVPERLELFMPVCGAIQHAHQKGVIHRDIKPSNIMVTMHDGVPIPKVIDFGIAKATQHELTEKTVFTQYHHFIGTPVYMSPEQAELSGLDIDTRSDIYSLGVVLYELLTGETPLERQSLMQSGFDEIRRRIREEEPLRPSTRLSQTLELGDLRPNQSGGSSKESGTDTRASDPLKIRERIRILRGDLDWVVMKALEKDRTRRYETANAFREDVVRFLQNEPVTAVAPSSLYRFRKFAQRNRVALTAAAAFTVLLLAATITSGLLALWAKDEQNQTAEAKKDLEAQLAQTQQANRETEEERKRANQREHEAKSTLQRLLIQQGKELLQNDEPKRGLAYLARALRSNPTNYVAAANVVSALTQQQFTLAPTEPITIKTPAASVEFSPKGDLLVTHSGEIVQRWDARTGRSIGTPLIHEANVVTLSFDRDGDRILTSSRDGYARVWGVHEGHAIGQPLQHDEPATSPPFSSDGLRVATTPMNGVLQIWNTSTGDPAMPPLHHPGRRIFSLQFSPDGQRIAAADGENTMVWDLRNGATTPEILDHETSVSHLRFSPNGKQILTAWWWSTDAYLWDADTLELQHTLTGHIGTLNSLMFSPDGNRLVTSADDHTVRLWDTLTGRPINRPLEHQHHVTGAAFSPDGERLVIISRDHTARFWNARTSEPLGPPLRHTAEISAASFSPDGMRLATTSQDQHVRIWDTPVPRPTFERIHQDRRVVFEFGSGKEVLVAAEDLAIRRHQVLSARFSPDGSRMVTTSGDKTARIWSVPAAAPIGPVLRHFGPVNSAQFDNQGNRLITASTDGTAVIWDLHAGGKKTLVLSHKGAVSHAEFEAADRLVLTLSKDGVRIWDSVSGAPTGVTIRGEHPITQANFSPRGEHLITATEKGVVQIWDTRSGQSVGQALHHEMPVITARVSPDGTKVLTASQDQIVQIWDAMTGQRVGQPIEEQSTILSARFSPDGTHVVTASSAGVARQWDVASGSMQGEAMRHSGPITSVRFSPDGSQIATASLDQTVQLWDARSGQSLGLPVQHSGAVSSVCFSPDGDWLLTISDDHGAQLWEVPATPRSQVSTLATLAEAVAGQRINDIGGVEVLPESHRNELIQNLTTPNDSGGLASLTNWLRKEPSNRSLSPSSPITFAEYVQRRIEADDLESLREALILSPTNGVAYARIASFLKRDMENTGASTADEAHFSLSAARHWAPDHPDTLTATASFQIADGKTKEAWRSIDRALQQQKPRSRTHYLRGTLLEKANRLNEAIDAYSEALTIAEGMHQATRKRALAARARLRLRLGQTAKASSDWADALGIPLRDHACDQSQLDLTLFYRLSFQDNLGNANGSNMDDFSPARVRFDEVEFDARGIIPLYSARGRSYPKEVTGIPVENRFSHIHFLHTAGWETRDSTVGALIATYTLNYEDGSTHDLHVKSRMHLCDWYFNPSSPTHTSDNERLGGVWTGRNAVMRHYNRPVSVDMSRYVVFKTTWPNPHPDKLVESIDLVASEERGSALILAITVE